MAAVWKLWHSADKAGYARSQAEYQSAAELQRESNRGRAYKAEEKQATQAMQRERYITKTTEEVIHAAQSLSVVPVPDDARRLLNAAAQCAREDRPASCGAGNSVPGPP
jgi:hypothetical protein